MRRFPWFVSVIALAGCGEVKSYDDAATVDATPSTDPDAPPGPPDAVPRGLVEVTVNTEFSPGVPQAGITVVFVEPDGTLAGRALTDDQGKASAEMTSGGSVTTVRIDTSTRLVTILAVEAGDTLLFGAPPDDDAATATVAVTFTRLAAQPSHVLHTTCGTSFNVPTPEVTATQAMTRGCDRTPRDLVLEASGATTVEKQFAVIEDQTAAAITVPASAWQFAPTGAKAMFTAVTPEVKRIQVGRMLRSGGRRFFASIAALATTDGRAAFSIPIPNALDAGDDMIITSELIGDDLLFTPKQTVRERREVGATTGVDVAAELLPWVSGPRLDAGARTLTWTQQGGGDIDALVAEVSYNRGEGDSQQLFRWRVIAPTSTGSLVYPDLPAELGDIEPRGGDRMTGHPSVFLIRHGDESYRELRAHLDRDDDLLSFDGADIELETKLTVSKFVCGRGCSLPLPTLGR